MDKKDIECMENGFGGLTVETEDLRTLLDVLSMATDYINLNETQQNYIFRTLQALVNDLYIHIDDLQDNFLRLTKWSE